MKLLSSLKKITLVILAIFNLTWIGITQAQEIIDHEIQTDKVETHCFEEEKIISEPSDVVIILDHSGSMTAAAMDVAQAAKDLISVFEEVKVGHRIALGGFSSSAEIKQGLTDDYHALKTLVDDTMGNASGSTNLQAALDLGRQEWESNGTQNGYLILMSDGNPNIETDKTLEMAQKAKDAGMTIISIAYGEFVNPDYMASLTLNSTNEVTLPYTQDQLDAENNDGDDFYMIPNRFHLKPIFVQIAKNLVCPEPEAPKEEAPCEETENHQAPTEPVATPQENAVVEAPIEAPKIESQTVAEPMSIQGGACSLNLQKTTFDMSLLWGFGIFLLMARSMIRRP